MKLSHKCLLLAIIALFGQDPIPDPISTPGARPAWQIAICEDMLDQIRVMEAKITGITLELDLLKLEIDGELATILRLQQDWTREFFAGADKIILDSIMVEINIHLEVVKVFRIRQTELMEKLNDLRFRWVMLVLDYMMEC